MGGQFQINHKTDKRIQKTFRRVVRNLENLKYAQRSPEQFTKILDGIQEERARLFRETSEIAVKHERQIRHRDRPNNPKRQAWIDTAQINHRHFERLGQLQSQVYDALQEQIIRKKMILFFGSRTRYIGFQFLVFVLIILVLVLLALEFLLDLSPENQKLFFYIDTGSCCVFLLDFFLRLSCAEDRSWYWKRNWIDLVTSIPVPTEAIFTSLFSQPGLTYLPFVRAGRLFRLLRIIRLARVGRFLFLTLRGLEQLGRVANVRLLQRSFITILVILFVGTFLLGPLELNHESNSLEHHEELMKERENIDTTEDQIWWTFTTVVTQGFADIYNPRGPLTRILTALLIISGIVFVGVFTATLTSIFVGEKAEEERRKQRELIELRLQSLERRLGLGETDDAQRDLDVGVENGSEI